MILSLQDASREFLRGGKLTKTEEKPPVVARRT